jgi:hypothetical protein
MNRKQQCANKKEYFYFVICIDERMMRNEVAYSGGPRNFFSGGPLKKL